MGTGRPESWVCLSSYGSYRASAVLAAGLNRNGLLAAGGQVSQIDFCSRLSPNQPNIQCDLEKLRVVLAEPSPAHLFLPGYEHN